MSASWTQSELPGLQPSNHSITSPEASGYNCIAWAAGDEYRWWWPDPVGIGFWPEGVERTETVQAFVEAFGTLGYSPCSTGSVEAGIEKIALFATVSNGLETPTHAARQLESGQWTSKLGPFEDISHESAADVAGPLYGEVVRYFARRRK